MRRSWRVLGTPALLALVFLASTSSVLFAPEGSGVAAWWPAAGLSSAVLVLEPARRWPWLLAALALTTGAANAVGGREVLVSALFGIANASEALVVALLLRAHRGRPTLDRLESLARLVLAGALGALLAGLEGALVVHLVADGAFWDTWRNAAASHGASQLLVLPIFLGTPTPAVPATPHLRSRRVLASAAVLTALAAFTVVFAQEAVLPLAFLPLPTLVWAALVLGRREASGLVLAIGVLCTLLTARGLGPLAVAGVLDAATVGAMVQVYLVVLVSVTLPLAVTVEQRRAALAEVEASRDTYRRGMAESLIAMLLTRPTSGELEVLEANEPARRLLGDAARPGTAWRGTFPADLHQVLRDEVQDMLEGRASSVEHEWWMERPEPRCVQLSLSWVPRTRTGDLLVVQLVDVTDARRAEQRLGELLALEQASVARLEELDRTKSEFVSAVSHELRTPLTTLIGFAQVLTRGVVGELSDQQQDVVSRMERNGKRLLMLIEDLLTLSRLESTPVREVSLFRAGSVVRLASDQLDDLTRDRRLDVAVVDDAPDAVLSGDPHQLERVLVNLLSNAVKFTPDGGRVRLWSRVEGDRLTWTVTDSGLGVPPEDRDHLFDRFYRSSTAVASEVPGTGLGLTIVRSIVEQHGGSVGIEDHPGPGTTFRVALPLGDGTPEGVPPRDEDLSPAGPPLVSR